MSTIIHSSIGGVGPGDRDRTMYKVFTRLHGKPDGDEFEAAVSDFERAGGDIRPLTLAGLWRLRDTYRAFLCVRGSRFAEGVGAWLDSNEPLNQTLLHIAMLLPRDTAIARVQAEILGNAIKTFGIVRAADKKVFAPLSKAIRDRAAALLPETSVGPSNPVRLHKAVDLLRQASPEERASRQWENHIQLLLSALGENAVELEAANALTGWSVLHGKLERIVSALRARKDISSDGEEAAQVEKLYGMLAIPDGTDILRDIAHAARDLNGQEEPSRRDAILEELQDLSLGWHRMHRAYLPSRERPSDMDALTYASDILGATVTGNDALAKGIHEDALTTAIAFVMANIRSTEALRDKEVLLGTSQQGILIESVIRGAAPPEGSRDIGGIPLPGLFPRHQGQATMSIGNYGAQGRRFVIVYPQSALR